MTFVLVALIGCNTTGDSGQDRLEQMGELSEEEQRTFCEWQTDELGGEGAEYDCGGGSTYTVSTVDSCVDSSACYSSCDLSVGENEDCTGAMAADPCNGGADPACRPVFECLLTCLGAG
jgi:hypothetical protein